jgi:hypothetical protein
MSKSNNLLLNVASLSMTVCRRHLTPYSHRMSPRRFTQAQLMTCLMLRAYLKTTYRGVIDILQASEGLRECLGLRFVPNYSTLKKFSDRIASPELVDALLGQILRLVKDPATEVAIDSTGMESTTASAHYQARRGLHRHQYVKLSLAVICTTLLAAGLVVSWGPTNDKVQARELLTRTAEKVQPAWLYADAGYDAEWVHQACREDWGVKSLIPPVIHRNDGTAGGRWRTLMTDLPKRYGRRWHAESFMSGLKRTMGSTLAARSEHALFTEAALRVLAYALRR